MEDNTKTYQALLILSKSTLAGEVPATDLKGSLTRVFCAYFRLNDNENGNTWDKNGIDERTKLDFNRSGLGRKHN
jgi:hypothetical protein